jgi:2-keto-4-pentenoate hydratase
MMPNAWNDPRIVNGMKQQLRLRRELLRSGQHSLGWKLAFGGPAALERLHINAPLVGFLMKDAVLPSNSTVSIKGWVKTAVEPEIAVYMGRDLPANASRENTIAAIAGLGAAIEVADVEHPSEDVEGTLVRNIYQRHVILSDSNAEHAGGVLTGMTGLVYRNGSEMAHVSDFEALTGELIQNVAHIATLLSFFDETLSAGDIIIAGSITPPIWVQQGESIGFQLQPFGPISVNFAA